MKTFDHGDIIDGMYICPDIRLCVPIRGTPCVPHGFPHTEKKTCICTERCIKMVGNNVCNYNGVVITPLHYCVQCTQNDIDYLRSKGVKVKW